MSCVIRTPDGEETQIVLLSVSRYPRQYTCGGEMNDVRNDKICLCAELNCSAKLHVM